MGWSIPLQTEWTGWLVAILLGVQIALPFLLRRVSPQTMSARASQGTITKPKKVAPTTKSMGWHYLLGFAVPLAALAHGWIPMASGHMPHTSMTGLWLATFALGLLFVQPLIGLATRQEGGGETNTARLALRRVHLVAMLLITALALSHMLMN